MVQRCVHASSNLCVVGCIQRPAGPATTCACTEIQCTVENESRWGRLTGEICCGRKNSCWSGGLCHRNLSGHRRAIAIHTDWCLAASRHHHHLDRRLCARFSLGFSRTGTDLAFFLTNRWLHTVMCFAAKRTALLNRFAGGQHSRVVRVVIVNCSRPRQQKLSDYSKQITVWRGLTGAARCC